MTLTANPASVRNFARANGYGTSRSPLPGAADAASNAERPRCTFEIAALREDGSLFIGQGSAPAVALFENAFSAFTHGSLIQTTSGPVAVEDLQPGDRIQTAAGAAEEVIWIGTSAFTPARADKRMPLVRILPDSLGPSRPERSLTVGPGARILHTPPGLRGVANGKRLLTSARQFVDGVNVIEVTPPTPTRLFHICLSRHAIITVDGLEMDTFHPGAQAPRTVSHALRNEFISLFPRIKHLSDFGPQAHPHAPAFDT